MQTRAATVDRLSELVSSLIDSPDLSTREAIEGSIDENGDGDALFHVAAALVALRPSSEPADAPH